MFKIEDIEFTEEIREKVKKMHIDDFILLIGALTMAGAAYIQDNQTLMAIVILLGIGIVAYSRFRYKKDWACEGCHSKLPWYAYMRHMTNCVTCGRTYITDEKRKLLIEQGEIQK